MNDLTKSKNPSAPTPGDDSPYGSAASHEVLLWVLEGHDERHIRDAIAAKFPGLDPDTTLTQICNHFATIAKADSNVLRGFILESYRELYRRMVAIGDYKAAATILKDLSKL